MDASQGKLSDAQIKDFLESHLFIGGDVVGGGFPKVTKITHLTAHDYEKLHGVTLMLPPNEELVLVELSGPFHLNRANAPAGAAQQMAKAEIQSVQMLIDVATGNLEPVRDSISKPC